MRCIRRMHSIMHGVTMHARSTIHTQNTSNNNKKDREEMRRILGKEKEMEEEREEKDQNVTHCHAVTHTHHRPYQPYTDSTGFKQ